MLDWCTQKVYYIVYKFMTVTLSVITGGLYTIISESKFTQPSNYKILANPPHLLYDKNNVKL